MTDDSKNKPAEGQASAETGEAAPKLTEAELKFEKSRKRFEKLNQLVAGLGEKGKKARAKFAGVEADWRRIKRLAKEAKPLDFELKKFGRALEEWEKRLGSAAQEIKQAAEKEAEKKPAEPEPKKEAAPPPEEKPDAVSEPSAPKESPEEAVRELIKKWRKTKTVREEKKIEVPVAKAMERIGRVRELESKLEQAVEPSDEKENALWQEEKESLLWGIINLGGVTSVAGEKSDAWTESDQIFEQRYKYLATEIDHFVKKSLPARFTEASASIAKKPVKSPTPEMPPAREAAPSTSLGEILEELKRAWGAEKIKPLLLRYEKAKNIQKEKKRNNVLANLEEEARKLLMTIQGAREMPVEPAAPIKQVAEKKEEPVAMETKEELTSEEQTKENAVKSLREMEDRLADDEDLKKEIAKFRESVPGLRGDFLKLLAGRVDKYWQQTKELVEKREAEARGRAAVEAAEKKGELVVPNFGAFDKENLVFDFGKLGPINFRDLFKPQEIVGAETRQEGNKFIFQFKTEIEVAGKKKDISWGFNLVRDQDPKKFLVNVIHTVGGVERGYAEWEKERAGVFGPKKLKDYLADGYIKFGKQIIKGETEFARLAEASVKRAGAGLPEAGEEEKAGISFDDQTATLAIAGNLIDLKIGKRIPEFSQHPGIFFISYGENLNIIIKLPRDPRKGIIYWRESAALKTGVREEKLNNLTELAKVLQNDLAEVIRPYLEGEEKIPAVEGEREAGLLTKEEAQRLIQQAADKKLVPKNYPDQYKNKTAAEIIAIGAYWKVLFGGGREKAAREARQKTLEKLAELKRPAKKEQLAEKEEPTSAAAPRDILAGEAVSGRKIETKATIKTEEDWKRDLAELSVIIDQEYKKEIKQKKGIKQKVEDEAFVRRLKTAGEEAIKAKQVTDRGEIYDYKKLLGYLDDLRPYFKKLAKHPYLQKKVTDFIMEIGNLKAESDKIAKAMREAADAIIRVEKRSKIKKIKISGAEKKRLWSRLRKYVAGAALFGAGVGAGTIAARQERDLEKISGQTVSEKKVVEEETAKPTVEEILRGADKMEIMTVGKEVKKDAAQVWDDFLRDHPLNTGEQKALAGLLGRHPELLSDQTSLTRILDASAVGGAKHSLYEGIFKGAVDTFEEAGRERGIATFEEILKYGGPDQAAQFMMEQDFHGHHLRELPHGLKENFVELAKKYQAEVLNRPVGAPVSREGVKLVQGLGTAFRAHESTDLANAGLVTGRRDLKIVESRGKVMHYFGVDKSAKAPIWDGGKVQLVETVSREKLAPVACPETSEDQQNFAAAKDKIKFLWERKATDTSGAIDSEKVVNSYQELAEAAKHRNWDKIKEISDRPTDYYFTLLEHPDTTSALGRWSDKPLIIERAPAGAAGVTSATAVSEAKVTVLKEFTPEKTTASSVVKVLPAEQKPAAELPAAAKPLAEVTPLPASELGPLFADLNLKPREILGVVRQINNEAARHLAGIDFSRAKGFTGQSRLLSKLHDLESYVETGGKSGGDPTELRALAETLKDYQASGSKIAAIEQLSASLAGSVEEQKEWALLLAAKGDEAVLANQSHLVLLWDESQKKYISQFNPKRVFDYADGTLTVREISANGRILGKFSGGQITEFLGALGKAAQ